MKTYCKPAKVDIENAEFNKPAIYKAYEGKMNRRDFQKVLKDTGTITAQELEQEILEKKRDKINRSMDCVAVELTQRIIDRDLHLRPIRQFKRRDGLTQKLRDICQEYPDQQLLEYIAVFALKDLFKAKILHTQYGSIPEKGQVAGKRKIERILRQKFKGRIDAVKGDVTKAYPSVTVVCVMNLLRRDIGKNKVLLWFLGALMENYPGEHLCIGGYLPSWLFNYVMSYVLRYILSLTQSRRGIEHKMVLAVVCYADDFTIFGYFSQLSKALKKATRWCKTALGLNIKNVWQIYHVSSFEEEKRVCEQRRAGSRKRTPGVDMMGYVVFRTYTIIRGRVFRRIRRQVLRAANELKVLGYIPWWRSCKLMAYKGWIKYSDSKKTSDKYNLANIFKIAARSVSRHGRKELIEHEKRMLCIAAA